MNLNVLKLTYFFILKSSNSIQFDRKIINMTLSFKIFTIYTIAIFSLSYLTLSVGCILLPHNFNFESPSNF